MSKWNLIINVGRCTNCYNCVIAEQDEHVGNDFPGYAAPAAPQGDSTIRIRRRVQGAAPMVETDYLPVMCNHCDNPPCKKVGGDAIRKRDDGIVIIDPEKARGRRDIVKSCPYGAIVWNEEQQLPQAWIFDAHLLDADWSQPRCQQVCPTDVFETVKIDDAAMKARAQAENLRRLHENIGAAPRIWYRDLDRWESCFIGGSVSATVDGRVECVKDAKIILRRDGVEIAQTTSDAFGDFQFKKLPKNGGPYEVEARHELGAANRRCELGGSVYLGEISIDPAQSV
jgi:Fe-S-cluster-containing dehydrogenase component